MPWTYHQDTGKLYSPDNVYVVTGYSGYGPGKNNPLLQAVSNQGPIPLGSYEIGEPHYSTKVGQFAMTLTPDLSNVMYGRFAFMIHGDSKIHPGLASHGCIIIPRWARELMNKSTDRNLEVVWIKKQ